VAKANHEIDMRGRIVAPGFIDPHASGSLHPFRPRQGAPRCTGVVPGCDHHHSAPVADYVHPRELSRGVEQLLVNGRMTIADGRLTGTAGGRVRLHRPTPGTCP
jgi:N-acyl-D-aspartate/D-glutamate deacylase